MSRGPSLVARSTFSLAQKFAPRIFAKYGFTGPRAKWMGTGGSGTAWLSPTDVVVKLTPDTNEAGLALLLEGKNPIGFPRVHAVRFVEPLNFYAIFMERVTPARSLKQKDFTRITDVLNAIEAHETSDDPWYDDITTAMKTIFSEKGDPDTHIENIGVSDDGTAVILDLGHGTGFHGGVKLAR